MGAGYSNWSLIVAEAKGVRNADNLLCGTLDTLVVADGQQADYLVLGWMLRPGYFVSNTLSRIPPHTAYIDNTSLGVARGLPIGAVTALTSVSAPSDTATPAYDLQGRRVAHPQHGIYIIGGKKVVVK
jgi:hypothetical protein